MTSGGMWTADRGGDNGAELHSLSVEELRRMEGEMEEACRRVVARLGIEEKAVVDDSPPKGIIPPPVQVCFSSEIDEKAILEVDDFEYMLWNDTMDCLILVTITWNNLKLIKVFLVHLSWLLGVLLYVVYLLTP